MLGQLDPHFIGNVEVFSPSLQEVHMFQNKRVFVVLSVIVLLALVLAGCSGSTSAQTGSTSSNFTGFGTVKQISYTDTVESTGQIEPQHLASLSFSTTGTVAQNKVQVGQSVNAGDILMTLDPSSVTANLLSAQNDLTNALNAYSQLTNPDLSTISNAQKALSSAYTNFQQAEAALSNAIIDNQSASDPGLYKTWLESKTALDTAQNNLPLANASIDIQAYYQAVRDTSQLKAELTSAENNASIHPTNTALAQKVTDLQTAVQNSQTKENDLQAGLLADNVQLVQTLSDKLDSYNEAASAFIGLVTTNTSNTNLAQLQADLTSKQSTLLSTQDTLQSQTNKRAVMNGIRCDAATIANYQDAYNAALERYNLSAHIVGSREYNAMQTAAANLTWCSSAYSAAEIAAADANIASTQAQIQLLQTQIASDQAQINDSGNAVYGLAINLNTVWAAYQDATQQLNGAVITLYQLERSPNSDDLAAAQAKVQSAQAEVRSMTLIAPFSGEVTTVGYQPGDIVNQSTAAIVLVDRSKLYVNLQIDEAHVVKLSVGDTATISLESNSSLSLTGSVSYINPIGTSSQGIVYYDVRVVLDQTDPTILIGATADVTIQAGQPQNVLTVPVNAVGNNSQSEYVYVIGSNNSSQQITVISGQILSDNTVIITGNLKAGDTVGLLSSTTTTSNNGGGLGGGGRFIVP
jgi:multidrug efflux pump subunit AcrA (membrane-fusion protein)